jgi:hypothetical protein
MVYGLDLGYGDGPRPEEAPVKFRLVTTTNRVIEVESGQPVTALAAGESVKAVQTSDPTKMTDADRAWVASHVAPLMR